MNIFLTGEIGVGKSTAIEKFLAKTSLSASGMLTRFKNRESVNRSLWMYDLMRLREREIVRFREGEPPEAFTDVFDGFGAGLLREAAGYELAIVDELGFFESRAEEFKRALFALLDAPAHVLGVIKPDRRGWLEDIRRREDVLVIAATLENRDLLPERLAELLESRGM